VTVTPLLLSGAGSWGFLNDLYRFNPTSNTWSNLSVANPPSARSGMGFAATPDGMLYVFGGRGSDGGEGTSEPES
jgi:N-acetylneuraminic acid mutarotase